MATAATGATSSTSNAQALSLQPTMGVSKPKRKIKEWVGPTEIHHIQQLPPELLNLIFHMVGDTGWKSVDRVSRNWRTCLAPLTRCALQSSEISILMGAVPYALRAVTEKVRTFVANFPNMVALDCTRLRLADADMNARQLIPTLMRAWPRPLEGIVVPRLPYGVDVEAPTCTQVANLFHDFFQACPDRLSTLDLHLAIPRQLVSGPLAHLKVGQVPTGHLTTLTLQDFPESQLREENLGQLFPALRSLTLEHCVSGRSATVARALNECTTLQDLKLLSLGDLRALTPKGIKPPAAENPSLMRVELVQIIVYESTLAFFQGVSKKVELVFSRCMFDLHEASFTLSHKAVQNLQAKSA